MDGSPFLEVASGTDLGADVLCTGIVACEYRVTASNGQGTGAASAVRTVGTAPGPVRRIDARIQSSDLGTGVSGIGLTFDLPASGMPVDQVELAWCTIAAGATSGCGTNANPNIGDWGPSEVVAAPLQPSMTLSETCSSGSRRATGASELSTCGGGAGPWRSVDAATLGSDRFARAGSWAEPGHDSLLRAGRERSGRRTEVLLGVHLQDLMQQRVELGGFRTVDPLPTVGSRTSPRGNVHLRGRPRMSGTHATDRWKRRPRNPVRGGDRAGLRRSSTQRQHCRLRKGRLESGRSRLRDQLCGCVPRRFSGGVGGDAGTRRHVRRVEW